MSEPRHAMIYRDGVDKYWWLEIVVYDVEDAMDAMSDKADTFGGFDSQEEAEEFAENYFQNTGAAIPVLDPELFGYIIPPSHDSRGVTFYNPQSYIDSDPLLQEVQKSLLKKTKGKQQ